MSSDRRYRKLSSDQGYRQLSNDRFSGEIVTSKGGYEYKNHNTLYAYDNPTVNNDVVGESSGLVASSFGGSQYQCRDRNPTFALDTPPDTSSSSLSYLTQQQQQTLTSLSLPYMRRAGDYSNYFSQQDSSSSQQNLTESQNRPTTLEVSILICIIYII